ncbi:uncharacterized protein PRCAT00001977001 [Priceomyces carsonii]|uniref:uncharacterized protein n=1 Tax=Priceomyces carsonii TaxID=28549 RepID=UPI002ED9EFA9|nr:unnamed protein product [Priceomyces carsonii]
MKTHLLSVPTKKTEEVDWIKPLGNYLASIYGKNSDYLQDILNFNQLRQDIRDVNADATGVKLYYKYYSQLELIDLRIPFSSINKLKKINFTWYDAFLPSIVHKQASLPFEKANVLFNLGAMLSRCALRTYGDSLRNSSNESSENLTKETLVHLQLAAGIYDFLNENFLHAPSNDLSKQTIQFLKKLMLAQSQEIFVLKVISGDVEQTKNSLIAKLCLSTSVHFEECFKMIHHLLNGTHEPEFAIIDTAEEDFIETPDRETEEENEVSANIDPLWIAITNFKFHFYQSLASYFNGLALESSKKYGEAIAYLSKSLDILNDISNSNLKALAKAESGDVYELLDNFKYQKDAVNIKLTDLNKDNDFIYHDIIPSINTLPEIKPMDSAKVIALTKNSKFNEINEYNYENFLHNVVPITIYELLSYYSEEKSQFLRNELDLVDVSNEEMASALEYMKMPKSVVHVKEILTSNKAIEKGSLDIDGEIFNIARIISSQFDNDSSNMQKIIQRRKQIYSIISECESVLSQQISHSSMGLKDSLIKLKKSLYDASNSDSKILGLINGDNAQLYKTLGKGPNSSDFKTLFEPLNSRQDFSRAEEPSLLDMDFTQTETKPEEYIQSIENCLHDLHTIKTSKSKLVESLKKEIHNDDISDILILNSKTKSTNEIKTVIFAEEMKKFEPYNQELDKLIADQKRTIKVLTEEWEKLTSDPKVKKIQSSSEFKRTLISDQSERITDFYNNVWKAYSEGLKRGDEFYNQLLNYAERLKNKINIDTQGPPVRRDSSLSDSFDGLDLNPHREKSFGVSASPKFYSSARPSVSSSQDFGTGSLARSDTGLSNVSNFSGYSRPAPLLPNRPQSQVPPQLPPKGIQQGSAMKGIDNQGDRLPQPPWRPSESAQEDELIYNQPSTYQPNMYNFFSKTQ